MTNDKLVPLSCPSCGAALECKDGEMKVYCPYCETSVLVRDFVTEKRIDDLDRLEAYFVLAQNAQSNKDWQSAAFYYEKINRIKPTDETVTLMNLCMYYLGRCKFKEQWLEFLRTYPPVKYRLFLEQLIVNTYLVKENELKACSLMLDSSEKKHMRKEIIARQASTLSLLEQELSQFSIIKCTCGAILNIEDESCPKCGKTKQSLIKTVKIRRKYRVAAVALAAVLILIVITIFSAIGKKTEPPEKIFSDNVEMNGNSERIT